MHVTADFWSIPNDPWAGHQAISFYLMTSLPEVYVAVGRLPTVVLSDIILSSGNHEHCISPYLLQRRGIQGNCQADLVWL